MLPLVVWVTMCDVDAMKHFKICLPLPFPLLSILDATIVNFIQTNYTFGNF